MLNLNKMRNRNNNNNLFQNPFWIIKIMKKIVKKAPKISLNCNNSNIIQTIVHKNKLKIQTIITVI